MKRYSLVLMILATSAPAIADNIADSNHLLCSTSRVVACFEDTKCITLLPWEADVPQFIVVDTEKKVISTTKASGENRSTPIRLLQREDSSIFLQGIEQGRAFSFVIDESTGLMTVAVSRDGLTVSVFGACTDTDI